MAKKHEFNETQLYLESLTAEDLKSIIKYGLRNSGAPAEVTVDDIYYLIQSNPI